MIFITGATGHIGNNLAKKLSELNQDFTIISRKHNVVIEEFKDKTIIADIFELDTLVKYLKPKDILIHLAAYINLKNDRIDYTYHVNYKGVKTIANFCHQFDIYFIYTSSTDTIKNENYLITEPNQIYPEKLKNHYQISKAKATQYLLNLQKEQGMKSLILYPSAIIGIHDYKPSAIAKEIMRCKKRRVCFYFQGGYNFIDVEDCVKSIISAMNKKLTGQFILSGHYLSLYQMYQLIFYHFNKKVLMIKIPRYVVKFVSLINRKLRTMISPLLEKHNYNNQKMIEELKIIPKPMSLTIENTVKWLLEEER
jgi:dihydroflavonol-4-reductase